MTVTAALDAPDSAAVTVVTPAPSEIDAGDNASVTVGSVSSSVSVSVTLDGAATPRPPDAVPETVTDLSGESTEFPFAVTVTAPELVVSPGAIVNISALDNEKSAATAPVPAAALTVTVTASLDAPESVAVTVAAPPVSETDVDDNASVTVGDVSSSSSVSVASEGAATPLPPMTVPETVTDLSGESTVFPFAVTVTAPVLVVSPAAMTSALFALSAKSAAAAPAPAAAPTVTVTASLDALSSVAVTVDTPPVSGIDVGDNASAAVGNASSSVSVSGAPVTLPAPCALATVAVTVVERPPPPWCVRSSTATIVTVSAAFAVSPAAITMVASETAVTTA